MKKLVISAVLLFLSCGTNSTIETSGVATWSDDERYAVIGINKTEMESSLFGLTEKHTRSSLFLCDKNVKPLDTLFVDRDLGGNGCKIINLFFEESQGYILVNSVDQRTDNERMDLVYLDGTIVQALTYMIAATWNRTESPNGKLIWDNSKNFYKLDTNGVR